MEQNLQASLLQASIDFPDGSETTSDDRAHTNTSVAIGEEASSEHDEEDPEIDDVTEPNQPHPQSTNDPT
jgi:hypothetical protein